MEVVGPTSPDTQRRSPKFSIRGVDGDSPVFQALLRWMQLEALPADDVADTSVGSWWVAYDEAGNPAGFAGLYHSSQHPNAGYLCRAGVLPAFRGRGLQRRLIAVRERKAKTLGFTAVYSDTYCNPQSSNNLIAAGYRMFSPAVEYAGEGTCYWRKTIS